MESSEDDHRPSSRLSVSRRKTIAADLDVHVVKFVYDTPNRVLRIFLILFLIVGIGFCTFYVVALIMSYMSEPKATKISIIRMPEYEYPPMVLCVQKNWNFSKANAHNLSLDAQVYFLTLTRKTSTYEHHLDKADLKAGELEFHKFAKSMNFSTYAEFYAWISLDSQTFIKNDRNIKNRSLEKIFVSGPYYDENPVLSRICYLLDARSYDPNVGHIFELAYRVENEDNRLGYGTNALALKEETRLILQKYATQLRGNRYTALRLKATKYVKIPGGDCVPIGEKMDNYSKEYCLHECFVQAVESCTRCTVMAKDTLIHGSIPACSWIQHPKLSVSCNDTVRDNLKICSKTCKKLCQYMVYQTTEANTPINQSTPYDPTVEFSIDYRVDQGLIVYEELITFTIDKLISEVGGQMGLWVGGSLLLVFELCVLIGQMICPQKDHD